MGQPLYVSGAVEFSRTFRRGSGWSLRDDSHSPELSKDPEAVVARADGVLPPGCLRPSRRDVESRRRSSGRGPPGLEAGRCRGITARPPSKKALESRPRGSRAFFVFPVRGRPRRPARGGWTSTNSRIGEYVNTEQAVEGRRRETRSGPGTPRRPGTVRAPAPEAAWRRFARAAARMVRSAAAAMARFAPAGGSEPEAWGTVFAEETRRAARREAAFRGTNEREWNTWS